MDIFYITNYLRIGKLINNIRLDGTIFVEFVLFLFAKRTVHQRALTTSIFFYKPITLRVRTVPIT